MLTLLLSVALLIILIVVARISAFIALIITALFAGLVQGMRPDALLKSVQDGLGNTLGGLVLVLAFGIILGSVLAETGAAQVISSRLLRLFGKNRAGLALTITGFTVGLAMFYNAGFVVLAPLVFSVAAVSGQSLVPLAIAMAAPLSVTHGFLPPHPGALAIANIFGADPGKTLLLGLVVAIPAVVVAGVYFPLFLKNIPAKPPEGLFQVKVMEKEMLPGFWKSMLIALVPVLLMAMATLAAWYMPADDPLLPLLRFWGDPGLAMLVAVLLALLFLGSNPLAGKGVRAPVSELLDKSGTALGAASSLLLIIAAGGAFKQVLIDSGIGDELVVLLKDVSVSPLLLGWGVATMLRISVGSATVAGMTAAGIAQPLVAGGQASPELMTLAIGAGSLMCSHVNDTGFWMFKEWFGLSLRDTFRSWTAMETIVGITGLAGVMLLDLFMS